MARHPAPFCYLGGKSRLAKRIASLINGVGRVYVEPFCGAANVFWQKEPHPVEVLNDLNQDIVNFFACMQSPRRSAQLIHKLRWTPYSLAMYRRALKIRTDPKASRVDRAWSTLVILNQSIAHGGRERLTPATWGRSFTATTRGISIQCAKWTSRFDHLEWYRQRLLQVQLDCRDGLEVIRYWDSPETIFYIDPPYPLSTRTLTGKYRYEMSDQQHEELIAQLLTLQGKAVVSCYPNPIYERLTEAGWHCVQINIPCQAVALHRQLRQQGRASRKTHHRRTEVLWWNYDPPSGATLPKIA